MAIAHTRLAFFSARTINRMIGPVASTWEAAIYIVEPETVGAAESDCLVPTSDCLALENNFLVTESNFLVPENNFLEP